MKKWILLGYLFLTFSAMAASPLSVDKSVNSTASTDSAKDKLINEILSITGIRQQVDSIPMQINEGIRIGALNSPNRVPEDLVEEMQAAAIEAYASEKILSAIVSELHDHWDEKRLRNVLANYSTPFARRVTALELKPPVATELGSFITKLASQPLSASRIALIKRLDESSKSSELAISVLSATVRSVAVGASDGCEASIAQFNKMFTAQHKTFAENIRNSSRAQMAYTYRELSNEELQKYIKNLETENGRWFTQIIYRAVNKEFNAAGEKLGQSLASIAKKRQDTGNSQSATQCQAA